MDAEEPEQLITYQVKDIPAGDFFSKTVYLDSGFVLASPEMPFEEGLKSFLLKWEFKEAMSAGTPMEEYAADNTQDSGNIESDEATLLGDIERIRRAEKFYEAFLGFVEKLFTQAAIGQELDFKNIAEKIKTSCEFIKEEQRFLLRVMRNNKTDSDSGDGGNYLASHAIKSTILSVIIGGYIKLPAYRMIELGVSALLHEIGMIKLPPQVYLSKRPLTTQERKLIMAHPLLGYNMLKSFDFPLTVTLGALEHHERENGSGYPRRLTGDKISLYAKIIAVACSYEALSAKRPHKEAKDGYTGMLELLKNEGKQYDDTIVRALVFSLSIYPIGLYVLLSSGRKGQVVDVNPEKPRFPIVQVFGELTPDGKNKIIETSQDGVSIIRPLTRTEIGQA